jgi:hypothetical protein
VTDLIEIFVNNILPIMLVAGAGLVVGRHFGIEPRPIATLIFYLLSPALVFRSLYTSEISGGEFAALYFGAIAFEVIMAVIAFMVLKLQGVDPVERAGVMISTFSLNAGNFGLPVALSAFDEPVFNRAVVVLIANVSMNYTLGVFVASNGRSSPLKSLGNLIRTPALYAVIVAFILVGFDIEMPRVFASAIDTTANAAIPMMLILLGLQLNLFRRMSKLRLVSTGVGMKLLFAPVLATGLAYLIGMGDLARTAFILQCSMPTAVLTIIFATEFELDTELALNLIMVSTLLSPITLSLLIHALQT